jgi:hypothetical protein
VKKLFPIILLFALGSSCFGANIKSFSDDMKRLRECKNEIIKINTRNMINLTKNGKLVLSPTERNTYLIWYDTTEIELTIMELKDIHQNLSIILSGE